MNLYNHILIFIDAENVMQRADTIADIGCGPGNIIDRLIQFWMIKTQKKYQDRIFRFIDEKIRTLFKY
ncbi:MAG TPA: hypothetical protein PKN48_16045 [Bacteroidales bacterium]|nr:hypothetical protein [Bacteroidales bacterium]